MLKCYCVTGLGLVSALLLGLTLPGSGGSGQPCNSATSCLNVLTRIAFAHQTRPAAECNREEWADDRRLVSSAAGNQWSHSFYSFLHPIMGLGVPTAGRREIRSAGRPATFGLTFHKCAQVEGGWEFPRVTVILVVNNTGSAITQVSIRDAMSGLTLQDHPGKVLERGFLTFTKDSLAARSHYVVRYTAVIKGRRDEVLELPAYLTFSNASQNDVNLSGPLEAVLTLRLNSTEKVYPNHGVHFAGFVGTFVLVVSLGFLLVRWMHTLQRNGPLHPRRRAAAPHAEPDPEYAVCNIMETSKEEAAFEDKLVDIMVLEDPQNMYQALKNLDTSNLMRAAATLESLRVQIYKDTVAALLRGLVPPQAERRLLGVLHGQLMGMEGKLKEEHVARVAAMAAQCNRETREEMEAAHRREASQKARAEVLFQHAEQQVVLEVSVLLDKVQKLEQNRLQCSLLARHEEASARVQRRVVEQRRVELHKIFCEELEEATRMGEMERVVTDGLLHAYFSCQEQLEDVLDVFLANQRSVLAERHAQRKFLVHSLQSLKSLVCEVFSKASDQMEHWFQELRREAYVTEEQAERLVEKAQTELVLVKQRLDEGLSRERGALHCSLIKKRRGLISDKLQEHKRQQKDLSAESRAWDEGGTLGPYLRRWQELVTAQCLELGELINNLDEEAAADIRKVTMRTIHGAMTEVKGIPSAAAQALLGPSVRLLSHWELVGRVLTEAQERLHSEGKAAQRTLQNTRDHLQHVLEQELEEQRGLRRRGQTFFQTLCAAQLTLSEEELLQLKLAFQSLLSRMDRCLVLPRALSRCRLQNLLAQWRAEQMEKEPQTEMTPKASVMPIERRRLSGSSELLLFWKQLESRIQLHEQEKEMENIIMKKVEEEMQQELQAELRAQEEALAVQTAGLLLQRAEKRARALETHGALLRLQTLLVEELRGRGSLGGAGVTQAIHTYAQGLEGAELELQKERVEWEALLVTPPSGGVDEEGIAGEGGMFHLEQDCRIAASLQAALQKCKQVIGVMLDSLRDEGRRWQVLEDLKEQLEFKGLYTLLGQELELAASLVKQHAPVAPMLPEALRILLPIAPETELLSLADALYPRQAPPTSCPDRDKGGPGEPGSSLLVRLKESLGCRNAVTLPLCKERDRLLKKRQNILEKLLSPSPGPGGGGKVHRVTVGEKPSEEPDSLNVSNQKAAACDPERDAGGKALYEPTAHTDQTLLPSTGETAFVFRYQSEATDRMKSRQKKRNFLNLKKASIAPEVQLEG